MGYDMYARKTPAPGHAEELRALYDALPSWQTEEGKTDEVAAKRQELWAAMDDARGYFRLNIWGMQTARAELFHAGVVKDVEQNGEWPDAAAFNVNDDLYEKLCDGEASDGDVLKPEFADDANLVSYVAALNEHRDGPSADGQPGIPIYKLGSNDGWLVTPEEIRSGIALADKANPDWRLELTDFVSDFVEYMEKMAKDDDGGFRVH